MLFNKITLKSCKKFKVKANRNLFRNLLVVSALFLAVNMYAKKFSYNEQKLGGNFKLVFYASNKIDADVIATETYSLVDSLNNILSNYLLNSEISVLNKKRKLENPSIELLEVLKYSQMAFNKTNGYFDISIQTLIKFWDKAGTKGKYPSNKCLEKQGKYIGLNSVFKIDESNMLKLKRKSKLELGGIAKGYIIDEVFEFLKSKNITSFLIEAAGDIRVCGTPENQDYWSIGVSANNRNNYLVNLESGKAIATSGKTYRFRIIEGKKYSHIVNPKSLKPITHNFTTSVIANNAVTADYLASTFNIVTDLNEIKTILKKHNNVELLQFSSNGIIFETDNFFN